MATPLRIVDFNGYGMYDDGPRFPVLPKGHSRVHCPWCLFCADGQTATAADATLNSHATAKHGWQQQKGA